MILCFFSITYECHSLFLNILNAPVYKLPFLLALDGNSRWIYPATVFAEAAPSPPPSWPCQGRRRTNHISLSLSLSQLPPFNIRTRTHIQTEEAKRRSRINCRQFLKKWRRMSTTWIKEGVIEEAKKYSAAKCGEKNEAVPKGCECEFELPPPTTCRALDASDGIDRPVNKRELNVSIIFVNSSLFSSNNNTRRLLLVCSLFGVGIVSVPLRISFDTGLDGQELAVGAAVVVVEVLISLFIVLW